MVIPSLILGGATRVFPQWPPLSAFPPGCFRGGRPSPHSHRAVSAVAAPLRVPTGLFPRWPPLSAFPPGCFRGGRPSPRSHRAVSAVAAPLRVPTGLFPRWPPLSAFPPGCFRGGRPSPRSHRAVSAVAAPLRVPTGLFPRWPPLSAFPPGCFRGGRPSPRSHRAVSAVAAPLRVPTGLFPRWPPLSAFPPGCFRGGRPSPRSHRAVSAVAAPLRVPTGLFPRWPPLSAFPPAVPRLPHISSNACYFPVVCMVLPSPFTHRGPRHRSGPSPVVPGQRSWLSTWGHQHRPQRSHLGFQVDVPMAGQGSNTAPRPVLPPAETTSSPRASWSPASWWWAGKQPRRAGPSTAAQAPDARPGCPHSGSLTVDGAVAASPEEDPLTSPQVGAAPVAKG
nr:arginine-glutamic acid dipeptide repeats protein-like [Pongo pygmaeus]